MPPRRPLPDLCLIAVMKMLTPNDQLKTGQMSPRCAFLVRAANRQMKMLVILNSDYFDGEGIKYNINSFSLASKPSYQGSDQLPELSILSQLKAIVISLGDRADGVFLRSLEHHAAGNVDLQVHLIGYGYGRLFGLSEPVRRRILRVANFMPFYGSDYVSLLCPGPLEMVLGWEREEGNQFVEPTQPPRPLAQLTSLKAFDLQLNLHSHEQMQWLKHLPVTMPRLQVIHLEAFRCASCGVDLAGYLRGGYSEDTNPSISTALECFRATLPLLHPAEAMPPRRPLPDLCLIAVMKMLTPNDQLKTAQMSPRCAKLVRAANRPVKMLVISDSDYFDGEEIKYNINSLSLASTPSSDQLPELSILSQLKAIVIGLGDRADGVFLRSLEHHAAGNVDLQVHLIAYNYGSLFGLSEPIRSRIFRVTNFTPFCGSDYVSNLCRRLPSLTSVTVGCIRAPELGAFFTALSTLSQLVHLQLMLCWEREEGNQLVEPTQPLRPLAQLTSLKAFDLQLNLHSHEQMQWLKHLPVIMPRLQVIHLEAFRCASCGVVLDSYLQGPNHFKLGKGHNSRATDTMPPRRPLTDLCLIAVMKMLTPNDQLKTAQMSPRCAILVRAANRRVKMLVIARSDDLERIQSEINAFSLASKPKRQEWANQLTSLAVDNWSTDLPTEPRLISAINALSALQCLEMCYKGSDQLPELSILSQLKAIFIRLDDIADGVFLRSLEHHAAGNVDLQVYLIDYDFGRLLGLSEPVRRRILRVDNFMLFCSSDNLSFICRQLPSLTSVFVLCIRAPQVGAFFTALSTLPQLVHLVMVLDWERKEGNQFVEPTPPPRPLAQLTSLKALDLSLNLHSHSQMQWLKHLPVTMPRLQAIHLQNFKCASCGVDLDKYLQGGYSEDTNPSISTALKCFRATLPLLHPGVPQDRMQWLKHLPVTMPRLQAIHLQNFKCASCGVDLDKYLQGGYSEDTNPSISTALKCFRATLPLLHPGVPQDREQYLRYLSLKQQPTD
ncbi:hypothetical protein TYRP_017466 [Tyrophagus putrescentiae]|nr:hypothetical protein TYRP_017466 [Tyrophagus putrescentiae]